MKNRCPTFCIGIQTTNYAKTCWDVVIHLRHYYVRYVIIVSAMSYFIMMDVILYVTLQRTDHLQKQVPALHYSPFTPLSVQSLMMDPICHYLIQPTTELLEDMTNFRESFPFLRPDVFAVIGVIIAIIAVKCFVSGHLRIRRYGVLLFTFRTWLVIFEGVVYRSYMGWKYRYELNHKDMRYSIDVLCYVISAGLLCYAILHHLLKGQSKSQSEPALLLYAGSNMSVNITSPRKTLLTVLSFTGVLLMCSVSWDLTVIKLTELLQSHKVGDYFVCNLKKYLPTYMRCCNESHCN